MSRKKEGRCSRMVREKTKLKRRNKIIINTKVIKDREHVFFYIEVY